MEEAVATVLVALAVEGFGGVVGLERLGRAEDDGPGIEIEVEVAPEMNAAAEVGAGGQVDRAATGLFACIDGGVNGGAIKGLAVAEGTVVPELDQITLSARSLNMSVEDARAARAA